MCVCPSVGVHVDQVDNKGNHLLVHEESSINVPAIAAAHVIKRYIAQASDELSFEVMIIIISKPTGFFLLFFLPL